MKRLFILLAALTLAACGTVPQRQAETHANQVPIENHATPGSGGYLAGDGPDEHPPSNIDEMPDAVPKAEPLHPYANRPYIALNKTYTPMTAPGHFQQRGIASWYGRKFNGQRTASGEKYDMYAMTAAHPTLPIPSYARVTNVATGKSVIVRINDRGPFLHDRIIDLSYTAAHKLGIVGNGSSEVEVESVAADEQPVKGTEIVQRAQPEPPSAALTTQPLASESVSQPTGNIFLQLGAFSSLSAAEQFLSEMRAKLGDAGKGLVLFTKENITRVRLGPYASLSDARSSRDALKDRLGFMPVLSLH
jgi:rare lipoprotein A